MTLPITFLPSTRAIDGREDAWLGEKIVGEIGVYESPQRIFGRIRAYWRTYLDGPCETQAARYSTSVEKAKAALEKHVKEWAETEKMRAT